MGIWVVLHLVSVANTAMYTWLPISLCLTVPLYIGLNTVWSVQDNWISEDIGKSIESEETIKEKFCFLQKISKDQPCWTFWETDQMTLTTKENTGLLWFSVRQFPRQSIHSVFCGQPWAFHLISYIGMLIKFKDLIKVLFLDLNYLSLLFIWFWTQIKFQGMTYYIIVSKT